MSQTLKTYLVLSLIAVIGLALFGYFFLGGVFGGTTIGVSITTNPDLERGLIGHWTFDGKDIDIGANIITDSSGQGNHGTTTGMDTATTTVAGKIGQALEFDGVDDYVSIPDADVLKPEFLTVSAWIKAGSFTNAYSSIVTKEETSKGWTLMVKSTGKLAIYMEDVAVSNPNYDGDGVHTLTTNTWYNLVFIYDGTNLKGYVNGILDKAVTGSPSTIESSTNPVRIGKSIFANREFDGQIDDVRIYNRALSADEIKRLYELGATTKIAQTLTTNPDLERGLVGHWTFDGKDIDLSQNTAEVRDRSGQGNHGDWINHATTTVIGKIGQAFDFDGVDDYVDVGDLATSEPATVSMWLNPDITTDDRRILSQLTGITEQSGALRVDFDIFVWDGFNWGKLVDLSSDWSGEWHHLVVTYSVDGSSATGYWDGVVQLTDSLTSNKGFDFSGVSAGIGAQFRGSFGNEFDGTMDDVRIYNRVLSAEEIKRLYQLGATTKVATTITTNPDLESGLVGHWTFDGKDINIATNVITDRSGQGNHGTTIGMDAATTTVIGKIGQALDFDGIDDKVNTGNDASLDFPTNDFTVGGWIKTSKLGSEIMFSNGASAPSVAGYKIQFQSGQLRVFVGNGTVRQEFNYGGTYADGEWHHIVFVVDRVNSKATGYADGDSLSVIDITPTGDFSTTIDSIIGSNTGGSLIFEGIIDDVRIYNRALSADEVSRLYDLGR